MCPGSHRDGLPDDDWRRTDFKRVPRDGGHGFQRMVGSHSTRSWAPAWYCQLAERRSREDGELSPGVTQRCPVRRSRATRPSPRNEARDRQMTTWRGGVVTLTRPETGSGYGAASWREIAELGIAA